MCSISKAVNILDESGHGEFKFVRIYIKSVSWFVMFNAWKFAKNKCS